MIKIIKILIALVMVCQLFSCGLVAKNGLVKEGENTYYYLNDKKQTGWQEVDGDWYFFRKGIMMGGFLVDADGKEYFLNYDDGKMVKNKFVKIEEGDTRFTIDNNQNIRAYESNGKTIEYSAGKTKEVNTGPGGRKFILDESGKTVKEEPGNLYIGFAYFGEDGVRLYNTQKEINGEIYIFDEKGLAKEAPYYSAKALAGGTYNFYLENIFPLYIEYNPFMSGYGTWIIREKPIIEVFYNSVRISGIVESKNIKSLEDFSQSCRLSMVDEQGITSSIERYAKSNKIYSGEKTRFEINFNDCLPLYGNNIYVRFVE